MIDCVKPVDLKIKSDDTNGVIGVDIKDDDTNRAVDIHTNDDANRAIDIHENNVAVDSSDVYSLEMDSIESIHERIYASIKAFL